MLMVVIMMVVVMIMLVIMHRGYGHASVRTAVPQSLSSHLSQSGSKQCLPVVA